MGIGRGKDGMIYVADMDVIEKANLHRHVLFRTSNIGVGCLFPPEKSSTLPLVSFL